MAVKVPEKFGPTYKGNYPEEMRTQLWPLCCGARIISGFKTVNKLSEDELVQQITGILDNSIPDHQVFEGETFKPKMTWLTLNSDQMSSKKIMDCIKKAGFIKVGEGKPRGSPQGFFLRDTSGTWKSAA